LPGLRINFGVMNLLRSLLFHLTCAGLALWAAPQVVDGAEPAAMTASELAARLSAIRQDGSCFVRARMQVKDSSGGIKSTSQLQIKSRSGKEGTEVVYQVLWPKEKKGEAVLLRSSGNRLATGALLTPPAAPKTLATGQMKEPLFESNLTYEDIIENFFAWDDQSLVGTEAIDRTPCQILESKPGKSGRSVYGSVRTWVDMRRMVPLRVEKFSPSGQLVRRIETTRVANDDLGRPIPAYLKVSGPHEDTITEMDGSRIRHGVSYSDQEFTPEGLQDMTAPKSAPE
jgi:hypothetical protein